MEPKFLLVAAIDFGTTFSGYAFSFVATEERPELPEQIRINKNWGANLGFQSYKTPTSVLIKENGEFGEFLNFGFEAEQQYHDEQSNVLLYRNFKMALHDRGNAKLSAVIPSVKGTARPALHITAHALRYLKDHLLEAIRSETGKKPDLSLIRWVITVPAIWSDESKRFMREAAYVAGCIGDRNSRQLVIALEPEAASLCCRRLHIAQYQNNAGISFPAGTKYLVLDCGGGTVDITVHITRNENKVKEILHASGGPWGGTKVDCIFIEFLESIFGKKFVEAYRKELPKEWLEFLMNFEKKKKSLNPDGTTKLNLSVPWSMATLFAKMYKKKSIDKAISASSDKGVSFYNGALIITNKAATSFFDPVIRQIVQHMRKLFLNPKLADLRYILMVGGFSECKLLQCEIKNEFERNGVRVLIPDEAQLAIIKGAVLFGHDPQEIQTRVAKKTYGCATRQPFEVHKHNPQQLILDPDGSASCDIFHTLLEKDQEVETGSTVTEIFHPLAWQDSISFRLFALNYIPAANQFKYADDPDLEKVGEMVIGDIGQGPGREIKLSLQFGATEIQVDAYETKSGKHATTVINFLSD